jgi:hypothetical protein
MKILVTGSRTWYDRDIIYRELVKYPKDSILIQGVAKGADSIARDIALKLGMEVWDYPAEWDKYGKSAGPIRNRQMLDQNPDLVLAFHKNIEESKGTKDCVNEATKRGIPVKLIKE